MVDSLESVDNRETESPEEYEENQKTQSETKVEHEQKIEALWKDRTIAQKCIYLISNITVEPLVAFYVVPTVISSLATQNLNLEKACRVNLGYSDEICDALAERKTENYTDQETEVQQLVASMTIWKTVLQSAFPAFLMLFLGSWSDRRGRRKPCMILPIIGELFSVTGLLLCTYFFYELPMEVSGVVEASITSLTGGSFTMSLGVFSYVVDISSEEVRTMRLGFANLFSTIGIPIGMALSGILYQEIGLYGVYSTCATMYVVALLYCCFRIRDISRTNPPPKPEGKCAFVRDFLDWTHLVDTAKIVLKKTEGNRRLKLLLLFFAGMLLVGPVQGERSGVIYLSTRYRFNWDEIDYSLYNTYHMIMGVIGTIICVVLFSYVLKMDDAIIGILSSISKILSALVYSLAESAWVFYLGPLAELLSGTGVVAMRAIASKLVEEDDFGKISSIFGVSEAFMSLLYSPMYNAIYTATMESFPGAFFIVGGVLMLPTVVVFGWLYLQNKKPEKSTNTENSEKILTETSVP